MPKTRSNPEGGNLDGEPSSTEVLADKVDGMQKQISAILDMISSLARDRTTDSEKEGNNAQTNKGRVVAAHAEEILEEDEEEDDALRNQTAGISGSVVRPFKVEARIDIPSYDGTMDAGLLDAWIEQMDTYFSLYGYSSQEKVAFARLKLTGHALVWWNAHLRKGQQNLGWVQFKKLIRQEFYPMGYKEDRWTKWHGLRQKREQSVQDYTTEFRLMALTMGMSLEEESVISKYVAGLYTSIVNELRLFPHQSFSQASGIAMAIERKNKGVSEAVSGQPKAQNKTNNNGAKKMERGTTIEQTSTTASTTKSGKYCEHCKLANHNKERCWKLHPELLPEKFKNQGDYKGKHVAVAVESDQDETTLSTLTGPNSDLVLMVGTMQVPVQRDPREELFTLRVQVKKELVDVIIDPGSQKNMVSASLVERLGLDTCPHPRPHNLNWINTGTGVRVDQQCKLRFAISREYIDEVVCDVVPLDVCQLLLGSPYLWDRDAEFRRRAQQYRLVKDGVKYLVNNAKIEKTGETMMTGYATCSYSLLTHLQEKQNKGEAGRTGVQPNQNSTKKELLMAQTQKAVAKPTSAKPENTSAPVSSQDGHSRVSKVSAQMKTKAACTDGRLKTVTEKKKAADSASTDGEWKTVCYKRKKKTKTPVCTDGNRNKGGKTQVFPMKAKPSTKTGPTTQMVEVDKKKKAKAPTKQGRGKQLPHLRPNSQE